MDNKYYTPEIEEFHVGFRYEYLLDPYIYQTWSKSRCIIDRVIPNLYVEESPHSIRVKYLDRDDIEELGWEFLAIFPNQIESYMHETGYTLQRYVCPDGTSSISMFKVLPDKGEGNLFSRRKEDGPYVLKLKNYNELERLMEMVGIIKQ